LKLYDKQSHANGLLEIHHQRRQPGGRPERTIALQEEIDALYPEAESQIVEI
jgi:hypothetical protein